MRNTVRFILFCAFISAILPSCNKKQTEVDRNNPFFTEYNTPFDVPPFEKIMAKHYMPAFEQGMNEGRKSLKKLLITRMNLISEYYRSSRQNG